MGFLTILNSYLPSRICAVGIAATLLLPLSCLFADGGFGGMDVEAKAALGRDIPSNSLNSGDNQAERIPAIEQADPESVAIAMGHYGRARSLLIAAMREFDKGTQVANPDAIIRSSAWRKDLAERAEELNHLLAPQPRATKRGMRYEADRRLLSSEAKSN